MDKKPFPQVIGVASGKGGAGKTTVSVNLAVALTLRGHKVMLFDADLGMANAQITLGAHAPYNISHVLSGEKTLEEVMVTTKQGVRLYEFDADGRLVSLAEAKEAVHDRQGWVLREVTRARFGEREVAREVLAEERWDSELDGEALAAATKRPRYLSGAELRRQIDYMSRNGLDPKAFENAYWARRFYPLNVVVLCLSALPFAFGSLRSGGFGKRLFIAIVIGIAYLLAQRLVVSLSDVYRFDARLAYLLPPLGLLAVSWGLFARRE